MVGIRNDLGLEMDWASLLRSGTEAAPAEGSSSGSGSCVGDILEAADSEAVAACVLTESQWEMLQAQAIKYPRWKGCPDPIRHRAVNLSGKATTLTSSYHDLGNHTTKYIFPVFKLVIDFETVACQVVQLGAIRSNNLTTTETQCIRMDMKR